MDSSEYNLSDNTIIGYFRNNEVKLSDIETGYRFYHVIKNNKDKSIFIFKTELKKNEKGKLSLVNFAGMSEMDVFNLLIKFIVNITKIDKNNKDNNVDDEDHKNNKDK